MFYYGNFHSVSNYNRQNAVSYALAYALAPNPQFRYLASFGDNGGDCSNFVSQCLRAGGAPFSFNKSPWWYRINISNRNMDTWSVSWSVAHSLYWTLKIREKTKISGLKAREVQTVDELELGDLIQYEDNTKKIYHSAIITAFTQEKGKKTPLISQHSVDARNITYIKPKALKMHFMKIEVSL